MTELIIPVKPLAIAKQRLASTLTPPQRAELVLAMLQDVLDAVAQLSELRTWIVTSDTDVAAMAKRYSCTVIEEMTIQGYNAAVEVGLRAVEDHCSTSVNVAIVPADIPLLSSADLAKLTKPTSTDTAIVRLAPSHDERGTNGIYLSTSKLLSPTFGENSFQHHRQLSNDRGATCEVLTHTTFAHDIDTPDDLAYLWNHPSRGAAVTYMLSISDNVNNHATR